MELSAVDIAQLAHAADECILYHETCCYCVAAVTVAVDDVATMANVIALLSPVVDDIRVIVCVLTYLQLSQVVFLKP